MQITDLLRNTIFIFLKDYNIVFNLSVDMAADIENQNKSFDEDTSNNMTSGMATYLPAGNVDHVRNRYPLCIVWTPIPMLTWFLPIIGHMGICTTQGIIRDFAGPYYVSEDNMGFGVPTKYWQLGINKIPHGNFAEAWDRSVYDASEEYKGRMHNLCCDNCHSHVAMALNLMRYDKSTSWNMINLCFLMAWHGKYVNICGFMKTWIPFIILTAIIITIVVVMM